MKKRQAAFLRCCSVGIAVLSAVCKQPPRTTPPHHYTTLHTNITYKAAGNVSLTVSQQNEVQPGVRVNEQLWKRFRQNIRDRKGGVRGHLKHELENAIESYLQAANGGDSHDRLQRIENDVATMKALLADAEADGGVVPVEKLSGDTRTHAGGKPNPNAPKQDKAEWIISEYYTREGGSTSRKAIQKQVENDFGFGDRAASDIAGLVIDELDAEKDPRTKNVYAWGDTLESIWDELEDGGE